MTTSRLPIPSLAELTYNVNKLSQPNIYLYHQLQPHHHPLSFQPSSSTVHHDYPPTPPQPPLTQRFCEPEAENDRLLLKQVYEQCTVIHKEIARYRVDALTETDRNKIVDLVYCTTESMMRSLKTLNDQLFQYHDQEIDNTLSSSQPIRSLQDDPNSSKYEMIRQARNLQDSSMRPKYRRRNKRNMIGQRCHSCNTTETPEWRRGPDGARTLCNACGLHYSKLLRKGSLTVQTHSYLLDSQSAEMKKTPRVIQFPIIQIQAQKNDNRHHIGHNSSSSSSNNNNDNNNNTTVTSNINNYSERLDQQ
ncbi:unnamed protein product [Rhizopus microsporus]|uniref:GATA-domain-containing protein n=2 Tax=Rhizopus TaxID=4842 RepID=A0A1X0RP20_RHIZD|nr:GATA-domain-containing protein [Rhizopus microsporus]